MATVTLHKTCKLSPASATGIKGGNVTFKFANAGTLKFEPASVFGVEALAGVPGDAPALQMLTEGSVKITVPICTVTGGGTGEGDGDSCVITVTSSGQAAAQHSY